MNPERKALGHWIRAKRKEAGMTVPHIAKTLGYCIQRIKRIEGGYDPIPIEQIHPYAAALSIPVETLLDQLRECEPDLYAKYTAIRNDISQHIAAKIQAGVAFHHPAFAPGNEFGSDKKTYVKNPSLPVPWTLYIMSTSYPERDSCRLDPQQQTLFPLDQLLDTIPTDPGVYLQ